MLKRSLQILFVCFAALTMMAADNSTTRLDHIGHKLVCQCGCGQILMECNHVGCPVSGPMIDTLRTQLAPERRFYNASQQTDTVVAIHSTLARDIYVVFEGRNPETDRPIIKVYLNPLVNWIWIGVGVIIFGTFIALVPPLKPTNRRTEAVDSKLVAGSSKLDAQPVFARLATNPAVPDPGAPHA